MPNFGINSTSKLITCAKPLQLLAHTVVRDFDCSVIYGFRDEKLQNDLHASGRSQKRWPYGKHNVYPSEAIDLAPYGCWGPGRPKIVWPDPKSPTYVKDLAVWYRFGGFVEATAIQLGISIRWGGDWDGDYRINDQRFDDLGHFELLLQEGLQQWTK